MTPETWWLPVYALNGDRAMDVMYESIDALLCAGRFDEVDQALKGVDLDRLSKQLQVGLLTITFAARSRLPSRVALYADIHSRLDFGRPGHGDVVLRGLE